MSSDWWDLERPDGGQGDDAHEWAVGREKDLRRTRWLHRPVSVAESMRRLAETLVGEQDEART